MSIDILLLQYALNIFTKSITRQSISIILYENTDYNKAQLVISPGIKHTTKSRLNIYNYRIDYLQSYLHNRILYNVHSY